jgi:hypothetical protein
LEEDGSDIFASNVDFDAEDLRLRKVHIRDNDKDKFSKLILQDDNNEKVEKLEGKIDNYNWKEEHTENFTQIIITSPRLIKERNLLTDIEVLTNRLQRLEVVNPGS